MRARAPFLSIGLFRLSIFFFFGIKIYLLLQPLLFCGLTVIDLCVVASFGPEPLYSQREFDVTFAY
jgi:hypothetical protein